MQGTHIHFRAYLALLIFLIVIAGFLYGLYDFFGAGLPPQAASVPTTYTENAPAPTAADYVAAQQSFQYLVSYTVSGFHPTTLSVKVGQTVRFTNNSTGPITIAQGKINSPQLQQGAYWQYTASSQGAIAFTSGNSNITITIEK